MNKIATLLAGLTFLLSACNEQSGAVMPGTMVQTPASAQMPATSQTDQTTQMNMASGPQPASQITTQALASCGKTNVAQGKSATASSVENASFSAAAAFDGNTTDTRWSSRFSDPQWLQVNLGSVQAICGVTLNWENAYGKAFRIETATSATGPWTPLYSTSTGTGGTQMLTVNGSGQYVRLTGTARKGTYGYSLFEMQVFSSSPTSAPSNNGYIMAAPPVTGVVPSTLTPPTAYFHEFQAQCAVSRSNLDDDPIIYPGKPGVSHSHTFMGNTTTNAGTTVASLQAGSTACNALADKSAYWMPTVFNGDTPVQPIGTQTIYYKSGVLDYTSVRPFPTGLRFVVGNMGATAQEFITAPGAVEGWECGNSFHNADIPVSCPSTPDVQLNIRYQAPSCWDGLHLDSPDHRSHMAYPVAGRCTVSHPVAVPMLEFKMAFPVNGDMSKVRLASGRGYSFHYDFFNAWDPTTLKAMVDRCIVAGRQCNSRGWDERYSENTAVLGRDFLLH